MRGRNKLQNRFGLAFKHFFFYPAVRTGSSNTLFFPWFFIFFGGHLPHPTPTCSSMFVWFGKKCGGWGEYISVNKFDFVHITILKLGKNLMRLLKHLGIFESFTKVQPFIFRKAS